MKHKHPVRILLLFILLIFTITAIILIVGGSGNKPVPPFQETVIGTGKKQALILFAPSNNNTTKSVMLKSAELLSRMDYTVTVNRLSDHMAYDLNTYDLLAFGTPVYMGNVENKLKTYIGNNPVQSKRIVLIATGMNLNDFDALTSMSEWFDKSNEIDAIKVGKSDSDMLTWFLSQCENNWRQQPGTGYFSIHDTADSGIDAVTGATMKK